MIWYRQEFSLPFYALRNLFSFYVYMHKFFSPYRILFFGSLDECLLVAVAAAAVCLFVCLFVCMYVFSLFVFFPFAKLLLFRFLSWFSISLTCSIYIHVICFLYISPRLYKYFLLYSS